MIRDHFKILVVNLSEEKGKIVTMDGRDTEVGGSGLAALLYMLSSRIRSGERD